MNSLPIIPKTRRTAKGSFESMNGNDLHIIDLDTSEYLGLQGMPRNLNYDPNSRFTTVQSPGRNNALYMFAGSDDVLEFELTWFATVENKVDVISRCKWLEIMTKADGYAGRPHYAKLKWGELYANSTWIITSAKYSITDFDKTNGYKPIHAKQTVGMRRIVITNPTHDQIANYQW